MVAILAVAAACLGGGWAAAGCGGGSGTHSDPTITVASKNTAEEVIVAEIYAQALEAAGFKVKRDLRLPAGLPPFEQKGLHISGYPEHLNIALKDILKIKRDVPGKATRAYAIAKAGLEKKGLAAFPPTSFSRSKSVGMLRTTAEERGLKTLSDLKGRAKDISLAAGRYCTFFVDCLVGLNELYGIAFGPFLSTEAQFRYKALETGRADAAILLSTEGRLAGRKSKFVILEDNKHLLPAGNVFWLTTTDLAEEAGPRYEKTILAAQKGLTLKVMQELDAKVKLDKQAPAKVAAEYLKSVGYKG